MQTIQHTDSDTPVIGYVINSIFNEAARSSLLKLQNALSAEFGNALWIPPIDTVHITLFDWIAPLVDYGKDKDALFQEIFESYDEAMTNILANQKTIPIQFKTIKTSPSAIFIIGQDAGEYAAIRKAFLEKITLISGTKLPPTIIHSTIARFNKEMSVGMVEDFLEHLPPFSFTETVSEFRLVKELKTPMLEVEIFKRYPLGVL